ncbi:MAG TPA: rhomboid family intramembrane serine protease [Acidobacteriaceae bacterium]|nr:rhomboid family intramembrane serine protease [Acidobacteriaceae bacterium]
MSSDPIQPQGEVIPPDSAQEYAPAQRRSRRREFSVWDPRSAPGTYFLLAINVGVYLWMVAHGVSASMPTDQDLVHYGANVTYLVLHGQWYRLLTAIFVHVGWIHIGTNMWCLWNLGILGEPLVGPWGMIAVYMITGIAGNLLSMGSNVLAYNLFHDRYSLIIPGAGASGAVFGIAGILIVLLSNHRLPFPWFELKRLRSSVVKFALINLVIGLSTRLPFLHFGILIDNSAHIGGFLSGLALGVPLMPQMTAGRERYLARQKITFAAACLVLALAGYYIARLA